MHRAFLRTFGRPPQVIGRKACRGNGLNYVTSIDAGRDRSAVVKRVKRARAAPARARKGHTPSRSHSWRCGRSATMATTGTGALLPRCEAQPCAPISKRPTKTIVLCSFGYDTGETRGLEQQLMEPLRLLLHPRVGTRLAPHRLRLAAAAQLPQRQRVQKDRAWHHEGRVSTFG
jgi:hypothetical protein